MKTLINRIIIVITCLTTLLSVQYSREKKRLAYSIKYVGKSSILDLGFVGYRAPSRPKNRKPRELNFRKHMFYY